MRRVGSRSRSRGRRQSGRDRDWRSSRSDRGGHHRDGRNESREPHSARSRDAPPAPQVTSAAKSGQQKAKEAMAKEKEKAMLKKQQRDKEQQERLAEKEQLKSLKEETIRSDIANAGALAIVSNSSVGVDEEKLKIEAMSPGEQAAAAAAAIAESLAARETKAVGSREPIARQCDEASLRQLYQLLDRAGKNAVSKRDVLVALKKHAPVRVLFGLPVGSAGSGDDLQARINAIQDAFESSSSLGEVGPVFEELAAAAGGSGQHVAWDSFLSHCQQDRVRESACKAVSLLPREHAVGVAFEATHEWQVVPEGAACGAGLEFKMDLATGRTLGRLARPR